MFIPIRSQILVLLSDAQWHRCLFGRLRLLDLDLHVGGVDLADGRDEAAGDQQRGTVALAEAVEVLDHCQLQVAIQLVALVCLDMLAIALGAKTDVLPAALNHRARDLQPLLAHVSRGLQHQK